jgi:hypothetical protein
MAPHEVSSRLLILAGLEISSALLDKLLEQDAFQSCVACVKRLREHENLEVKQHAKAVFKKWKRAYKQREETSSLAKSKSGKDGAINVPESTDGNRAAGAAGDKRSHSSGARKRQEGQSQSHHTKKEKRKKRKENRRNKQVVPGDLVWVYTKAGWVRKQVLHEHGTRAHTWCLDGDVTKRLHPLR